MLSVTRFFSFNRADNSPSLSVFSTLATHASGIAPNPNHAPLMAPAMQAMESESPLVLAPRSKAFL